MRLLGRGYVFAVRNIVDFTYLQSVFVRAGKKVVMREVLEVRPKGVISGRACVAITRHCIKTRS